MVLMGADMDMERTEMLRPNAMVKGCASTEEALFVFWDQEMIYAAQGQLREVGDVWSRAHGNRVCAFAGSWVQLRRHTMQ